MIDKTTRDHIIEAADQLFYRQGFEHTSFSDIADVVQIEGEQPGDRIRHFIHILIMNRAKIKRYGCPVGTLCTELAKLDHASQAGANKIFTLFRVWLRRQFTLLGRKSDADKLALHLLARSQGVAALANVFHDEKFIRQEVKQMCDWLESCAEGVACKAG